MEFENLEVEFDEIKLFEEWKLDLVFIDKWLKLFLMFIEVDLILVVYLSWESILMGVVNVVMLGVV